MGVSKGPEGYWEITRLVITGGLGKLPWGLKHWGGYVDDVWWWQGMVEGQKIYLWLSKYWRLWGDR